MPRITKTKERWFEVPGDPLKGRVKIKHLSPGELALINDKSFKKEMRYKAGRGEKDNKGKKLAPEVEVDIKENPVAFRELPIIKSVVAWENHLDEDDKEMECNKENIEKFIRNDDSFSTFINECREILAKAIAQEKKDQLKNSKGSASKPAK